MIVLIFSSFILALLYSFVLSLSPSRCLSRRDKCAIDRFLNRKFFKRNAISLMDEWALWSRQNKVAQSCQTKVLRSRQNETMVRLCLFRLAWSYKIKKGLKKSIYRGIGTWASLLHSRTNKISVWPKENLLLEPFPFGSSLRVSGEDSCVNGEDSSQYGYALLVSSWHL